MSNMWLLRSLGVAIVNIRCLAIYGSDRRNAWISNWGSGGQPLTRNSADSCPPAGWGIEIKEPTDSLSFTFQDLLLQHLIKHHLAAHNGLAIYLSRYSGFRRIAISAIPATWAAVSSKRELHLHKFCKVESLAASISLDSCCQLDRQIDAASLFID